MLCELNHSRTNVMPWVIFFVPVILAIKSKSKFLSIWVNQNQIDNQAWTDFKSQSIMSMKPKYHQIKAVCWWKKAGELMPWASFLAPVSPITSYVTMSKSISEAKLSCKQKGITHTPWHLSWELKRHHWCKTKTMNVKLSKENFLHFRRQ